MAKFRFRIRTRKGIVIDVQLPGRDAADAERELHQIYLDGEILVRMIVPLMDATAVLSDGQMPGARQSLRELYTPRLLT